MVSRVKGRKRIMFVKFWYSEIELRCPGKCRVCLVYAVSWRWCIAVELRQLSMVNVTTQISDWETIPQSLE